MLLRISLHVLSIALLVANFRFPAKIVINIVNTGIKKNIRVDLLLSKLVEERNFKVENAVAISFEV